MQWWMRPGTSRFWAIRKPSPSPPSSASRAEAHALVEDLGVAAQHAEARLRVLHRRDVADDRHAGRVDRHDEHRRAPVRRRVGVGDGHHDEEVGDRPVRGEPLVPVEHLAVPVADGAGHQLRRVRAGRLRLGHRERRADLAGEQRRRASAPSARACRRARGSRCCPSRAPGSRRPAARRSTCPRISFISPSLTWPKPWPPSSGGRCAAHRPRSLTCGLQRSVDAIELRLPERSSIVSIGQTSSRTNVRIHCSCSSKSGSVEKSQAT